LRGHHHLATRVWQTRLLLDLAAEIFKNLHRKAFFAIALKIRLRLNCKFRRTLGGELLMFLVWGFLVGIFAVWLYAAIRPRYGAGAKTALCAGAAVWGLGYLLASVMPIALHIFPRHIMAIGLAVGLVEGLVGTVAGAWLYREATA
jgi:hypothetical protein